MPRKSKDVVAALMRKGFHSKQGDHLFLNYFTLAGKKTSIRTKVSNGEHEIDRRLMALMARQCKLSNADFHSFVDCHIDQTRYEEMAYMPLVATMKGGTYACS